MHDYGIAGQNTPRGIRIDQLCKHLFICGVPGSGKTTATFGLLVQLCARQIPFLIIETAKREYRSLKELGEHPDRTVRRMAEMLEVYTLGNECVSPFRFNPLQRPRGVERDAHIDQVLRCFKGAMPMWEPLPALLGESLETVWSEGSQDGVSPTLEDLYAASQRVVEQTRYPADMKGQLLAALEVRLGMITRRTLGAMMRSTACIPDIAHLIGGYSILNMDSLDSEIKCLVTLFLLTAIHQQISMQSSQHPAMQEQPRLVIVIEEAHNVVGRSADGPVVENQADPKANATELICRMLAEFRALGVGLVLIDQLPWQVAPQVVKNTGTKLAFRQVARDDRETLSDTMLFSDLEYEEIARLLPGEAFLFAEGYHRSHRIRTPNMAEHLNLSSPPEDDLLAIRLREETWYQKAQDRRIAEVLIRFRMAMNRYEARKAEVHRKLENLLQQRTDLLQVHDAARRQESQVRLADSVARLGQEVARSYQRLEQGPYQEVLRLDIPETCAQAELDSIRQNQMKRFRTVIEPQAGRLRDFVKRTVAQLQTGVFRAEDK